MKKRGISELRLVIPNSLKPSILKANHNQIKNI